MDVILDTNALIFYLQGSSRLKAKSKSLISSPENNVLVSIASLWEISLKYSLGKLQVNYAENIDFPTKLESLDFTILELSWPVIRRSTSLPDHHRDPFDRILIAESQLRGLPIISSDRKFDIYGVDRIW